MPIVKRVNLGSSIRRVRIGDTAELEDGTIVFEHIYRELVLVKPGGTDAGLPDGQPGVPDIGLPPNPDQSLPDAPNVPNNALPPLSIGWPGCPGVPDNSLPAPTPSPK